MRKQIAVEESVYKAIQEIKRELEFKDNVDLTISDAIYECILAYRERDKDKPKKKH